MKIKTAKEWLKDRESNMITDINDLETVMQGYAEYYHAAMSGQRPLIFDLQQTCDTCGCHPSVIIATAFGRFCQTHARYV